jgi:hypothetical protein
MAEGRLPKRALKWMQKQKKAGGRTKKNWIKGIKKAMNERNLSEDHWEDRNKWSLGVGKRRKTFSNRYTYIVFSPWAGFGKNQSPVRRPVWLWHTAFWASS